MGYWLNKLKDIDNGVLCSWEKEWGGALRTDMEWLPENSVKWWKEHAKHIYIYPLCKKEEELRNIDLFIFTKRNSGRIKQNVLILGVGEPGGGNAGETFLWVYFPHRFDFHS